MSSPKPLCRYFTDIAVLRVEQSCRCTALRGTGKRPYPPLACHRPLDCLAFGGMTAIDTFNTKQSKNRRAVKRAEHSTIVSDGRRVECFEWTKAPSLRLFLLNSVETIEKHLEFVPETLENAAASESTTEHEVR
jgi:hypothetical protein